MFEVPLSDYLNLVSPQTGLFEERIPQYFVIAYTIRIHPHCLPLDMKATGSSTAA